jgi:hypothetical protein
MKTLLWTQALFLSATGCGGMMQSMMTEKVDASAKAHVSEKSGDIEVMRYQDDGNSFSVDVNKGDTLVTADLVLGSSAPENVLVLDLDRQSQARFVEADFVLRRPLGERNKAFLATVEYGNVEMNVAPEKGNNFSLEDTNKTTISTDNTAHYFVHMDDDGAAVWVASGDVSVNNSRTEIVQSVKGGFGVAVDADGGFSTLDSKDAWMNRAGIEQEKEAPKTEELAIENTDAAVTPAMETEQ